MLGSLLALLVATNLAEVVLTDTPANCTFEDITGTWIFHEGDQIQDSNVQCSGVTVSQLSNQLRVTLTYPNIATDSAGHTGTWTIIYNQGFEVIINNRRYFAFSDWVANANKTVTSYCHQTKPGWSHDIFIRDWSCFIGRKVGASGQGKLHRQDTNPNEELNNQLFTTSPDFIREINEAQDSWEATVYPEWEGITMLQARRMMGGEKSVIHSRSKPAPVTPEQEAAASALPASFDWRSVRGQNFVSPIRNQGHCGSCYAFASCGMMEARVRIISNNTLQPVFSTQDIVQCSEYAQGCDGGFPYLIAGKYAEDFGLVLEAANPYKLPEPKGACNTVSGARRFFATDYKYVGVYYGGCNEALMRAALVANGPIAVSFEVYGDFKITNHVVVIVGYGANATTGEKYWIVKNSWGANWGENGFFRIRRGTDECSIESLAVESTPIVPYSYSKMDGTSGANGLSALCSVLVTCMLISLYG